jgi:hypothetical protein
VFVAVTVLVQPAPAAADGTTVHAATTMTTAIPLRILSS